jgi:hypothetical protein
MKLNGTLEIFEVFQNQEEYFRKIKAKDTNGLIVRQIVVISVFTIFYGIIMGSYHSFLQAIVAGVKLWLLFVSTIIICFPSFYVIQLIIGSQIKLKQVLVIILSGFVMSTSVMIALSPISIFFLITGNNYYFLHLLHIAIFIFSGFFGIRLIIEALKLSCEKENIYPKIGVTVFKVWAVIFVFVGIQMAWNLRPFMGDEGKPFAMFRHYEGNFYTAIVYAVQHLTDKSAKVISTEEQIKCAADSAKTKKITHELLNEIKKQNKKDTL